MTEVIQMKGGPRLWDFNARWYRVRNITDECLDPDDFRRVKYCRCRLCQSKLTDPELTGQPHAI